MEPKNNKLTKRLSSVGLSQIISNTLHYGFPVNTHSCQVKWAKREEGKFPPESFMICGT